MPNASIILDGKRLEAFPIIFGTREGYSLSLLLWYWKSSLEILGKINKSKEFKSEMNNYK